MWNHATTIGKNQSVLSMMSMVGLWSLSISILEYSIMYDILDKFISSLGTGNALLHIAYMCDSCLASYDIVSILTPCPELHWSTPGLTQIQL